MEPALQRRVQRYGWDKASASYEAFWEAQLRPAQDLLLTMADLRSGETVLDVACGTGLVSFEALRLIKGGRFVGTDISEKMVEIARDIAAKKGEAGSEFLRMDAEELDLEDESFDAALCGLGLMYMPDPRKALEEMRRVLKPGGRAVAAVWGQRDKCGWADIFEIVDRQVTSEVCPMFFNLGNPNTLELYFTKAGFREVTVQRINSVLSYKNEQDAIGSAFEGGPVALAYHKFSETTKEKVRAEYLDSIAAFRRGDGFEVPGEFVVAMGRK